MNGLLSANLTLIGFEAWHQPRVYDLPSPYLIGQKAKATKPVAMRSVLRARTHDKTCPTQEDLDLRTPVP